MLTTYFVKQKSIHFFLLSSAALLLLTACDSGQPAPTTTAATPTSTTVTAANAIIKHSPSGTVEMMWDHTSHALTVHLALTGLDPKSTHPAFISSGSCKAAGTTVYPLSPVKADTIGFANAVTTIKGVEKGIRASGWYVDVRNGPDLKPDEQAMPISCANVFNPTTSTSLRATLNEAFAPNQAASGTSDLVVNNNQLTVTIALRGLAPKFET